MGESTEGVSVGVLEVAVLGVVGAGPTTALRLGAGGGADDEVRGVCVSRETHVYRVTIGMIGGVAVHVRSGPARSRPIRNKAG